jgi:predicted PolB exonuclease-like 3'-5' exonuclease
VRDEKWNYYLAKFQEKHGQHVSQVTAPETRGWAWVDFANLDQLLTFHARIVRAIESPIA